jgi:hypothetical protein
VNELERQLEASAARWELPASAIPWVFWAPIVGAVLIALLRLDKELYRFVLKEDGPVEWSQFACFLVACAAAAGIAARRLAAGHRVQGLVFLSVAAATFVLAGEEIAWGQRILGLTTPEVWRRINEQQEITIHNVGDVLDFLNVAMLAVGFFGFLMSVWGHLLGLDRWWDRAGTLFVPPLFLAPCFLMLFAYKAFRFVVWRESGFTITKYGEWFELCLGFALALFLVLNLRLLRHPSESPRQGGARPPRVVAEHAGQR